MHNCGQKSDSVWAEKENVQCDICHYCPDISVSLIERILNEMLTKGEIQKVGSGRSTAYVKQDNR